LRSIFSNHRINPWSNKKIKKPHYVVYTISNHFKERKKLEFWLVSNSMINIKKLVFDSLMLWLIMITNLSNNSITLITNQSNDIFNRKNCFLLGTYLNLRKHIQCLETIISRKNEANKRQRELITSRRQSCWMRRLIQRVPGIDFVLTTLYFPFGFQTSIDTGFAIEVA
jgi:hypothetical protein